jgi:hypothetical protein
MYLVRRVFKVKPGKTREAAQIIAAMGKCFEKEGRLPTRVYWSGYTVPGPINTVYMDWMQETLRSPFDKDATLPDELRNLYAELRALQEESYVEFYEMV